MTNNKIIYVLLVIIIILLICCIFSCCYCNNLNNLRYKYKETYGTSPKKRKVRRMTLIYSRGLTKCDDEESFEAKKELFDALIKKHKKDIKRYNKKYKKNEKQIIFDEQEVQKMIDTCMYVESQNGTTIRKSLFNNSQHLEDFYITSFPELEDVIK